MKFVYYSAEAASRYGYSYYKLDSGKVVKGTALYCSEQQANENYLWEDKKLMGQGEWFAEAKRAAITSKGVYTSREEWAKNLKETLEADNILSIDSIRAKGDPIMPNKDHLAGVVDRLCGHWQQTAGDPKAEPVFDDILSICTNANFIAETLQEFAQNKYDHFSGSPNHSRSVSLGQIQRWAEMEAKGAQTIRQLLHLIEVLRSNNG